MNLKFSSKNYPFSCSLSSFYDRRLLLSSIAIITITLVLLPSPSSLFSLYANDNDFVAFASSSSSPVSQSGAPTVPVTVSSPAIPRPSISSESSHSQIRADLSVDNFNLPDGYIIEPFLSNLSMPTSIAVDSHNGTIYIAESIEEFENNNSSNIMLTSPSTSASFLSQQPQVRIVKADITDNNGTIVNQTRDSGSGGRINDDNTTILVDDVLNWPIFDMEVDDASGLLYAFHDYITIWRINTTSGAREDILVPGEEQAAAAGSNEYEVEQQDPLSFLINSSTQIALSGKQDYHDGSVDDAHRGSNYDGYNPTVLYIPCMNGHVDNDYDTYCILSLPIDSSGNTTVENISYTNSPSFILENMTSRPVGIAILNSSYAAVSSSFSPSSSSISEQQSPYAPTGSETSNSFHNNNHTELLITTSQPTSNSSSIFNNNSNDNEEAHLSFDGGNYSADATAALSSLSTIYYANVNGSIPYQGSSSSSNNLQDTINNNNNNNNNNNYGHNSNNHNNHQHQTLPPPSTTDTLVDYPNGQLGKVVVVSVPPATISSTSSSSNETSERNQAPSTDEDIVSSSSSAPIPFGLNETTAFIADFGNSSASEAEVAPYLPKIIMLDVQTGNIAPFLTPKQPDPNFVPIDIVFDYNSSALYVLSIGNNQGEDTNNNTNNTNNLVHTDTSNNNNSSGIIWKISYQGEEGEEATTGSNSSNISNGTDNNNDNTTSSLGTPLPSSSNDTDSIDNSSSTNSIDSNGLSEPPSPPSSDDSSDSTSNNNSSSASDGSTGDNSDGSSGLSRTPAPPSDSSPQGTTSPPDASPSPPRSSEPPPASSPPDEQSPIPPSTTQPPPSSTIPDEKAPVANDQTKEIEEDAPPLEIELTATDDNNNQDDVQTLGFTIVSHPMHGTLGEIRQEEAALSGNDDDDANNSPAAKATVTYTPYENYNGQDSFHFKVNDDGEEDDSNIATVTINITPVNDAPIAEDDVVTTEQHMPVQIDVLANDMDIDADDSLTIDSVVEQSTQGGGITRVIGSDSDDNEDAGGGGNANEKLEYTPAGGFFGTDEFTYTIVDTNGATGSATVTVTVKQVAAETEELPNNALEEGESEGEGEGESEGESEGEGEI